jgi:DNA-binding NtrC family response regulator
VGKDVLAREIHARSRRAAGPFVSVNCAASSESLLERELFGYEAGAFFGATSAKRGLIESSDGGTLFLDEIGELPATLQAKLLRVIDRHEVTRTGALGPTHFDARFIAATNRDLARDVAERRFRQDLYFRIKGVAYRIPPLRERIDDIESLACTFAEEATMRAGARTPSALGSPPSSRAPAISAGALVALRAHSWPGNVLELRHVIERAVLACAGDVILAEHVDLDEGPASALPLDPERRRVLDAVTKAGGNQREAARILGMSRGTLAKRLTAYGIARPRKRGSAE